MYLHNTQLCSNNNTPPQPGITGAGIMYTLANSVAQAGRGKTDEWNSVAAG